MSKQLQVAQKTLVISERPWIYLNNIALVEGNTYELSIRNSGNSVAVRIKTNGKIVSLPKRGTYTSLPNYGATPCARGIGTTTYDSVDILANGDGDAGFDAFVNTEELIGPGPQRWLRLYLIGCIQYKWLTSDDSFQTYFLTEVEPVNASGKPLAYWRIPGVPLIDYRLRPTGKS